MNVEEFITFFRNDMPNKNNLKSYDDYEEWHSKFYEKTSAFHQTVKQSYYEQTNKLVDENNFRKYYGPLSEFSYLGLFKDEDEVEFSNLIRKLTKKLDNNERESEIKAILDFLYNLADFLFHEYYPAEKSELRKLLNELKDKILKIQKYDRAKIGELVIRFIDLMI